MSGNLSKEIFRVARGTSSHRELLIVRSWSWMLCRERKTENTHKSQCLAYNLLLSNHFFTQSNISNCFPPISLEMIRKPDLIVFVIDAAVETLKLLELDETGQGCWRCVSCVEVGVFWEWIFGVQEGCQYLATCEADGANLAFWHQLPPMLLPCFRKEGIEQRTSDTQGSFL